MIILTIKRIDMARMNLTPADDLKNELWGPIGTPERDAMEAQLKEEIHHKSNCL